MMRTVDHDEVARLTRQGFSLTEIAERVGCSTRHVGRIRVACGVAQPPPALTNRPITPERLEAVARMLADGASNREIMRTLGVHYETLQRYFPGTAWSQDQVVELSRAVRKWGKP